MNSINTKILMGSLLVLVLCIGYAVPTYADTVLVTITVLDSCNNPISGATARWNTGSWHNVPGSTDGSGQLTFDVTEPYNSIVVTYRQTSASQTMTEVQDAENNPVFQTIDAGVKLADCAGNGLAGGVAASGIGSWVTIGTTGLDGTVAWEVFPGEGYHYRMSYNHKSQEGWYDVPGVVFQTTELTINHDDGIKSNSDGTWWYFSKPSMNLLPGDYPFYFQTGSTWDGPLTISVSGCSMEYTYQPNLSPIADPDGPYLGNVDESISFDGTDSFDPDGDDLTYEWDFGDGNTDTGATPSHSYASGGIYNVCLIVNDGTVDSEIVCTTVVINQPPDIDVDNGSITIDEGQTATNSGDVSDQDGDTVSLSVSIGDVINNDNGTWSWSFDSSDGTTESQEVIIEADDGNGGTSQATFNLTVNNVAPTAVSLAPSTMDPIVVNTPVTLNAVFIDPADDVDENYTSYFDWDGNGIVDYTMSGTYGSCSSVASYSTPGVYKVKFKVIDKDSGESNEIEYQYIVVYDASAGFVTGGGWIWSPAGAYAPAPDLEGKASFGFVAKYKKGASVPDGNTEFQFKAGDLNFHSSSYEWLVVNQNDSNAQFKGSGTINGLGDYKFMLWAGDKEPDTFRIKIWEEIDDTETIIYDNGSAQEIGGGNIVVHSN